MAVRKFSAIAAAGAISGTDTIIGVQAGTTDVQYTVTAMAAAILSANNGVTAASTLTAGRIPMGDGARGLADTGAGTIGTSLAIGGATIGSNALAVTGAIQFSGNLLTTTNQSQAIATSALPLSTIFAGEVDFSADNAGNATKIAAIANGELRWQNKNAVATVRTFLAADATWQWGAADAAVAVAQITRVQSVVAGTVAANGANWTLRGSLSTGTGISGDIIFQTGVAPGSGTTQATATTALTIKGETQALVTTALDAGSSTGGALQVAGGASIAKRVWMPAITASAGIQTAVLCQSSGGEVIADSVACLASSARFKTLLGDAENGALDKIIRVPIHRWKYRRDPNSVFPDNYYSEHIGPTAEDVEAIDSRLVGRDQEGKARSISTDQLLALTIQAVQEQQEQIEGLKKKLA